MAFSFLRVWLQGPRIHKLRHAGAVSIMCVFIFLRGFIIASSTGEHEGGWWRFGDGDPTGESEAEVSVAVDLLNDQVDDEFW